MSGRIYPLSAYAVRQLAAVADAPVHVELVNRATAKTLLAHRLVVMGKDGALSVTMGGRRALRNLAAML